jgi:hypothetical protein
MQQQEIYTSTAITQEKSEFLNKKQQIKKECLKGRLYNFEPNVKKVMAEFKQNSITTELENNQ